MGKNEPVKLGEITWQEQTAKLFKFTPERYWEKRLYWVALSDNTTIQITSQEAMNLIWGGSKCH